MEKLKKAFGAIWKWLKANWLVIIVIVAVGALAFNSCSNDESYRSLFQQYTEKSDDHQRQIKDMRDLQEQERKARDLLMQEYIDELHRIEREYKTELGKIAEQRNNNRNEIIRNHDRDPTSLTDAVNEVFGIPVE